MSLEARLTQVLAQEAPPQGLAQALAFLPWSIVLVLRASASHVTVPASEPGVPRGSPVGPKAS